MEKIKQIIQRPVFYKTSLKKEKLEAFTLIEIIVAVSIFSIIMISIMSVYFTSTNITYKSDINRIMHENIKNVLLTVSEDIMKNPIKWVSNNILSSNCTMFDSTEKVYFWDKLCLWSDYYIAKKDSSWNFIRKDNAFCSDLKNNCYIVKDWKALTNDLVRVSDLQFFITNSDVNKVTMTMTVKPTSRSTVKASMIKNTKITTQITLSERKYK